MQGCIAVVGPLCLEGCDAPAVEEGLVCLGFRRIHPKDRVTAPVAAGAICDPVVVQPLLQVGTTA